MEKQQPYNPARFGTVLGIAPGEVPVYSSHYPTVNETEMSGRESYKSYVDDVFMGYKWQCVELARRWLYLNKGYVFDNVPMAYDIFELRSVRVVKDDSRLPLRSFRNGSHRHPEPGCLLIWNEGGEFAQTGHVAIVTEVCNDRIRCIEQNVDHVVWKDEQDYSRELGASVGPDGEYTIHCTFPDTSILGWVIQTDDDTYAEKYLEDDPSLYKIEMRNVENRGQQDESWLDIKQPCIAAYVETMHGHKLCDYPEYQHSYLWISDSTEKKLKHATHELHAMFLNTTHVVIENDALLERFNIPKAIWPKLRHSWNTRSDQAITGRFDFSMTPKGLKVFEYNIDSAACYLECGHVQVEWAKHFGCRDGRCSGELLFNRLVEAWEEQDIHETLHIIKDNVPEENYHSLYMKSAIEKAGINCKIIENLKSLSRDSHNRIIDSDGEVIRLLWKTWLWETALSQIRADCEKNPTLLTGGKLPGKSGIPPGLPDLLFSDDVTVYEPLWTLVTNNKAMLAILWQLFPDNPYLLPTQFELTDALRNTGYVVKPFSGIAGSNISIYDENNKIIASLEGRFEHYNKIYQAYWPLPKVDHLYVQISTFTAGGKFSGACARVDTSSIINAKSSLLPLRAG